MKFKDYVTLGNLVFGYLSVIMVIRGDLNLAAYMIIIAHVFDMIDGPIARLTGQQDNFGNVLDSTCDFVTGSIAPGFIIYAAFTSGAGYPWPVAAALGILPVAFGTIRQARYQIRNMSYPCYFIGLPRPVFMMASIALLQSSLFRAGHLMLPGGMAYHLVAVLIVAMAILHLSTVPFPSHHGRRWMGILAFGRMVFMVATPLIWIGGLLVGAPWIIWDILVVNMVVYIFMAWSAMPARDLGRIRHYIKTGEVILPLCHRSSDWRSEGVANFFRDRRNLPTPPADTHPALAHPADHT